MRRYVIVRRNATPDRFKKIELLACALPREALASSEPHAQGPIGNVMTMSGVRIVEGAMRV